MSNHTPGPWKVSSERTDDGSTETVLYGQRQWIHAIGQPWVPERIGVLDDGGPDAYLIAAAPDLLGCLEWCVEWMEAVEATGYEPPLGFMPHPLEHARAAIAKATDK